MSDKTRTCVRTGQCCMSIPINWSPKDLRDAWESWSKDTPDTRRINDITQIYPMLANRCLGKRKVVFSDGREGWKYIYGPCRNLDWKVVEEKLTPSCAIHENKPDMCSGFPHYGRGRRTEMTDEPPVGNPGTFKGCGFNSDPEYGKTVAEHGSGLVPLDEDEL